MRRLAAKLTMLLVTVSLLGGCGTHVREYAGHNPPFDLREFFNGELEAWGMVQERDGKVARRFHVGITATWRGNVGILDERFTYNDGETQHRVWTITRINEHKYRGTAGDIIGAATGEAYGNALNWRYTMELPVDNTTYEVTFDDWMFLIDEAQLINRADITKFGITVAEVTLFIQRQSRTGG